MRLNELDLMRFLAALSVVLYHYTAGSGNEFFPSLSYLSQFGYLGVDFFFMISGFVIFASAENRSPSEFAISRLTRVYPTLFVCATLTVIIVTLFDGSQNFSVLQYLANLTLLNTYAGVDYIDGVYWTLLVELKFYMCVFILLLLGWFDKYRLWLGLWLLMTITFFLIGQPFFKGIFISPEYSAFFIAGIVFYLVKRDGPLGYYLLLLGVSLLLAMFRGYVHVDGFIGDPSLITRLIAVSIIVCFFAVFFQFAMGRLSIAGSSRLILTLGGMTYPLYLLHSRAGRAIFGYFEHSVNPVLLTVGITVFMLLLSYLIYTFFEKTLVSRLKKVLMKILSKGENESSRKLDPKREPV